MDEAEIRERVKAISESRGDPGGAHSMEDKLYRDVLRWIKGGHCKDPQLFAILVLETEKIDFPRWGA